MSDATVARTGIYGSDRRRHPRGSVRQDALAQPAPVRRPGGDRLDRLYGPRQFRHQHPGRGQIRLCAAVGGARSPTSPPCSFRRCRPSSASSPGATWPRCAATISPSPWSGRCGSSAKWRRWRPTSPNSLAAPSGSSLLLHIPLIAGMGVTAVLTYGILMFEGRGFRPIEIIIGALVGGDRALLSGRNVHRAGRLARGGARTSFRGFPTPAALTIAVGIVGATIMPHAIFLHSGLTQNRAPARNDHERRQLVRFSNIEVVVALGGRRPRQYGDGHHGGERLPRGPQRRRGDRDRL